MLFIAAFTGTKQRHMNAYTHTHTHRKPSTRKPLLLSWYLWLWLLKRRSWQLRLAPDWLLAVRGDVDSGRSVWVEEGLTCGVKG